MRSLKLGKTTIPSPEKYLGHIDMAPNLRNRNGKAKRHLEEMFEKHTTKRVKKKLSAAKEKALRAEIIPRLQIIFQN